ncbi:MAG: succinate dehydrogenase, cytochrome b556 subunit [Gammaproteobacteria bacterium]|nr:succinate dehydrogenase, cytochrome b556 subunit [Gammaproteobacteria bacterium]MCP5423508.1 succinate dehydrogenase, cytochrome b556 subunit [Gammaproteobacteria bacterium]
MVTDKRPLSPHLQIYKPQLTSVLSITHRATGVALAIGTLLLVYWLVSAAAGEEAYHHAQIVLGSMLGQFFLFLWTWALFYHLSNGIRHLFWDAGYGFDLETAYRSGRWVIWTPVILTMLVWIVVAG